MKAICISCGSEFSELRFALGYHTCLLCGTIEAIVETAEKRARVAVPYNKGGYQYITPKTKLSDLGKK